MSTYHNYGAGEPPVHFRDPVDMDDLQRIIDRFLAKHPIEEDLEKTKRIDAILARRKLEKRSP